MEPDMNTSHIPNENRVDGFFAPTRRPSEVNTSYKFEPLHSTFSCKQNRGSPAGSFAGCYVLSPSPHPARAPCYHTQVDASPP